MDAFLVGFFLMVYCCGIGSSSSESSESCDGGVQFVVLKALSDGQP